MTESTSATHPPVTDLSFFFGRGAPTPAKPTDRSGDTSQYTPYKGDILDNQQGIEHNGKVSDAINDLNEYEKSITDYQSTHDKSALERANHAFDDLEKITGKMSTAELDAFYDQAHGMNSNGKTMPGTHDLKPENVLGTQGSFYPGHSMDNVKGYSSDPKVQDALKDLNAHNEALATYRKTNDPADLAKLQAAAKKLNQDVDPATMTDKQYHEYFLNALGLGEDGREMSGARDLLPANAGFDGTGANRDKMYPNLARHDALAK